MYDRKQEQARLDDFIEALDKLNALPLEVQERYLEDTEKGMEFSVTQLEYGVDPDGYFALVNDVLDLGQDFLYPTEGQLAEPDRTYFVNRVAHLKQQVDYAVTYDFSHVNKALILYLEHGYINLSDQSVVLVESTFSDYA